MGRDRCDQAFPRAVCRRERRACLALLGFQRGNLDGVCSSARKNWSSNCWRLMAHLLSHRGVENKTSSPGIEPGLQPSQGRVHIRHTPRTKHPVEESNPFFDVRSVACVSGTLTGRRSTFACIHIRRRESNPRGSVYKTDASPLCHAGMPAGPPGFEPGASVLETDCSPRSTDLFGGCRLAAFEKAAPPCLAES